MSKNYDNTKPYTNIYEMLPSVFQSDVNKSLTENMFNKFFTKNELSNVVGTISSGQQYSDQIIEPNPHRQRNQLQPLLTTKIATEYYISSFKDLMNEASRIGIDVSKFDEWGATTQHNFIPPIDLDKLINYADYVWLSNSTPEYITIKNRYYQLTNIIKHVYADNPTLKILAISYYATDSYDIKIAIKNAADVVCPDFIKMVDEIRFIEESKPENRVYTSGWDWFNNSLYSKWDNVDQVSSDWDNPIDGLPILNSSNNSLVIANDWTILLSQLDSIIIDGSTIIHITNATYNSVTQQTTITTVENVASMQGLITISSFDSGQFDDADIVGEWDEDYQNQALPVVNYFDFVLQQDDWSSSNKWVHILDLDSQDLTLQFVRATMPIIEYDPFIQLNSWSYNVYNWAYRQSPTGSFLKTSYKPSMSEIFAQQNSKAITNILSPNIFQIAAVDSSLFHIGAGITVSDGTQYYYYNITASTSTTITVDGILPQILEDLFVYPIRFTSVGDPWVSFTDQWLLLSSNTIPCEPQQKISYQQQLDNSVSFNATGQFTHWYSFGIEVDDYTQIRVYLNGKRQYGTYCLGWFDGTQYTLGSVSGKINAIWFMNPILSGNIVIETKSLAYSDNKLEQVLVNTSSGLVTTSLVEFSFNEQQKVKPNQYPMFDMFKLDGTPARKSSPLWTFQELDTMEVNPNIGARIRREGTQFFYDQKLVENDISYAYKEIIDQKLVLRSIWKTDAQNINYVPKFVNAQGEQVDKDDPTGDWELPKQMLNNLQHHNKKIFSGSDLSQHFKSILSSQPSASWLSLTNQNQWRLIISPAYGAGGTIKEMGGCFDTFLSSLYVSDVTVLDLLNFAKLQYNLNIVKMRQSLLNSFEASISTVNSSELNNILQVIINNSIESYIAFNNTNTVFTDTTMYNSVTKQGMPHWCITLPKMGMVKLTLPALTVDDRLGILQLTHHDGHTSTPSIPVELKATLMQQIVNNPLTTSGVLSNIPSAQNSTAGMIYYARDVGRLFKSIISYVGPQQVGLAEGAIWLNTSDSIVYKIVNGVSVAYGNNVWVELNLDKIYAEVLLAVELKLYSMCDGVIKFDTTYEVGTMESYFSSWCRDNNIANPYASVYQATNAFSWNYNLVNAVDYRINSIPENWDVDNSPATWFRLYELVYGTRYPHLEPWKLQKYTTKPSWWDSLYKSTTSDRKWKSQMWSNIMSGIIPSTVKNYLGVQGTGLPDQVPGYQVISVNITDSASVDGVFQVDDLLPPYYNSILTADANIVASGSLLTSLPNQQNCALPYVFGNIGPIEDMWRNSSDKKYDQAIEHYLNSPIKFTQKTIGYDLYDVGGLFVDVINDNIPSHSSIVFHGEIVDGSPILINGLNQLYINYLRYKSKDLNISDFKQKWKTWVPKLGYQFSNFVDVDSVNILTDSSKLDSSDFIVVPKKTPAINSVELTSLNIVVNEVGQNVLRQGLCVPLGLGGDWKFRINCPNINIKTIPVYGVNTTASPQTFHILDSSNTTNAFYHYPIDKSVVYHYVPGSIVSDLHSSLLGIQGLINFIDGYVEYLKDQGFNFDSSEHNTIDELTGRTLNWQTEIEKLVDQIYTGMVSDQVPIHFAGKWSYVSVSGSTFTLIGSSSTFSDGDLVQIHASIAVPSNLQKYQLYEVVNVSGNSFQLASVDTGDVIQLTDIGKGILSVGMYFTESESATAFYEVNPFKFNIVINHPQGILADIIKGSFNITNNQGLYDQYGRNIPVEHFRVFRGDKSSYIDMIPNIPNDFIIGSDNIHIGGASLSIDGYEHAVVMNDQLLSGALVYDDFLGLRIKKLFLSTRTQQEKTFRPSVGGRYYINGHQYENIESAAENLQLMYDTNVSSEDSLVVQAGRQLVGFEKMDYLDDIGITAKSQFLFYKAMIQQKGSTSAINAFINLKTFIDAQVDEYWAYRVAQFGDSGTLFHPQMWLKAVDSTFDNLLLQFTSEEDSRIDTNFTTVSQSDVTRWVNLPEIVRHYPNNMYLDAKMLFTQQIAYNNITKYIELQQACSDIIITASMPHTKYVHYITSDSASSSVVINLSNPIILNANCVRCIITRYSTEIDVQIQELSTTSINLYDWKINGEYTTPRDGDIINIIIQDGTLKQDTHYIKMNANTISFDKVNHPMHDVSPATGICIHGFGPNSGAISPIKLIDNSAKVSVANIIVWDPKRNMHNPYVDQIIDWKGKDPAIYTVSPFQNDSNINNDLCWLDSMVGQVWLDTNLIRYKPYWDHSIYTTFMDRVTAWGSMEEWCSVDMYEWVSSPVHPSQYATYVAAQSKLGNYINGTVKPIVKRRIRNTATGKFDNNWVEETTVVIDCNLLTKGLYYMVPSFVIQGTLAQVYVNGMLSSTITVNNSMISFAESNLNPASVITVVIPATTPTVEQLKFNPDVKDDLSINVQYAYDYKYASVTTFADNGVDTNTQYYFWVSNTSTNHKNLTLTSAQQLYSKPQQPYFIVDNFNTSHGTFKYTRCAIRGLLGKVSSDNRFQLRFVNNTTLRDDIGDDRLLKHKHEQWRLFRERQSNKIDKFLWNKLIEACSGRSLADSSTPIPSHDRVLYDNIAGTSYRFGLGPDQAIADPSVIQIITDCINDINYDLYPIDRDVFWQQYNFDNASNIENTLQQIYSTFSTLTVNRIWFAVLHDTFSKNIKFEGIMKTSWVQLDSIQILDTTGVL